MAIYLNSARAFVGYEVEHVFLRLAEEKLGITKADAKRNQSVESALASG
jgi:hypothetical protein